MLTGVLISTMKSCYRRQWRNFLKTFSKHSVLLATFWHHLYETILSMNGDRNLRQTKLWITVMFFLRKKKKKKKKNNFLEIILKSPFQRNIAFSASNSVTELLTSPTGNVSRNKRGGGSLPIALPDFYY